MKKYGYYIFNTLIVALIMVLVYVILAAVNANMRSSWTMVELTSNTNEEILEKYKDDEYFQKTYNSCQEKLKEWQESLNNYEEGTEEYNEQKLSVEYYEKNLMYFTLYNYTLKDFSAYLKVDCIEAESAIVVIYALGMFIYIKVKKSKEEKESKKTTKKTQTKKTTKKIK